MSFRIEKFSKGKLDFEIEFGSAEKSRQLQLSRHQTFSSIPTFSKTNRKFVKVSNKAKKSLTFEMSYVFLKCLNFEMSRFNNVSLFKMPQF